MSRRIFLLPLWGISFFLSPFDVYIITQKNSIGQRLFSCAIFQEKEYKLTISAGYGIMKIKNENENPHSLKMKIVRNFENENFYCSLRGLLKLKMKILHNMWIKCGKLCGKRFVKIFLDNIVALMYNCTVPLYNQHIIGYLYL